MLNFGTGSGRGSWYYPSPNKTHYQGYSAVPANGQLQRKANVAKKLRIQRILSVSVALLCSWALQAQPLEIDIIGGQEAAQPIAVTPFHWIGDSKNNDLSRVVIEDLRRTGRFDVLSSGKLPSLPGALDAVELQQWRQTDVEGVTGWYD